MNIFDESSRHRNEKVVEMSDGTPTAREIPYEEYVFEEEPFYIPVGDEVEIFKAAYHPRLPVNMKGPTGCGKTRFLEYISWTLGQEGGFSLPLLTVACHEDLTAGGLGGGYPV